MRFDCNEIGDIMSEVAAYGTAVMAVLLETPATETTSAAGDTQARPDTASFSLRHETSSSHSQRQMRTSTPQVGDVKACGLTVRNWDCCAVGFL